jgi:regulator of nucleoside diphosphate kinase
MAMFTNENKKFIAKEDFNLLTDHLKQNKAVAVDEKYSSIIQFIENAELIEGNDFLWEAVRLNSKVVIRDKIARLNYTYTVVMPELADHKQCRVSIFSVIGNALFGKHRGNDIYWKTPKGKRYFTIMAVSQMPIKQI